SRPISSPLRGLLRKTKTNKKGQIMNARNKSWIALSSIVIAGLVTSAFVPHSGGASEKPAVPPPPVSAAVTAPARALSNAFEIAAAQVKPAVVSVYSEKLVK